MTRAVRQLTHSLVLAVCAGLVAPDLVGAEEVWVAPTSQQDVGGFEVASNVVWPVTPIGAVRFVWSLPDDLQTFQGAKVAIIPASSDGASTLSVMVCPAQNGAAVTTGCSSLSAQGFTGKPNQLVEVEIGPMLSPIMALPGTKYLAVLAFTMPTTTTDHIVGLRFSYVSNLNATSLTNGIQVQQNALSPNIVDGFSGNSVPGGVYGATVAGGGSPQAINAVNGSFGTISGGAANAIAPGASYATIGGGEGHLASADHATVGGGFHNVVAASFATVAGGYHNSANADSAAVAGGNSNTVYGAGATIGGGVYNTAGGRNAALTMTVAGGYGNTASGDTATVGGGYGNTASGDTATVGGGYSNSASGHYATVAGGQNNSASGVASFAAGNGASANLDGCFVWSDSTTSSPTLCGAANQFVGRASGGVVFFTSWDFATGVAVAAGGGSWSSLSDRNAKEHFAAIEPRRVLARVAQLPIQTWNYKAQDATIRHIGPMAQDFYSAFEVGEDERHITDIDEGGVALAAIQGLHQLVQDQQTQIDHQYQQLEAQRQRLEALKTLVCRDHPDVALCE
jgi:hypothetical protein